MTRDEIAQALHLIAMGRANHPLQVELIDALDALINPVVIIPAGAFADDDFAGRTVDIELPKKRKAK